ncbi:MAG UNVERIFIED_CONTAM: hypothetical protein LVR18_35655 [Planctomycetaceae bacterium]
MNQTRRRFLLSAAAAAGAAATAAPAFTRRTIARQGAVASEKHFQIEKRPALRSPDGIPRSSAPQHGS